MTRILVIGKPDDDPCFVHNTLCEVNRIYGPVTCVIHSNHPEALAWQQWVSRRQPKTKHLPIVEDLRWGLLSGQKCRDQLFAAKPDYVVVIRPDDGFDRHNGDKKIRLILNRADRDDIPVLVYSQQHRRGDREDIQADEVSVSWSPEAFRDDKRGRPRLAA